MVIQLQSACFSVKSTSEWHTSQLYLPLALSIRMELVYVPHALSLSQLMTHQNCCHFSSSKTSSGIGSINTRSDTCLRRQRDRVKRPHRRCFKSSDETSHTHRVSSSCNQGEMNSVYRVRWMGSEPQKGQYFQSLGPTGLTQLNIWVLKPHIRADEMLNLSDGGLECERSVPFCPNGSFAHGRYKCLEEKPW